MVRPSNINFCVVLGVCKLIEEHVGRGKGVAILDGHVVKSAVVDAKLKFTAFFGTKRTGDAAEEPGSRMRPLVSILLMYVQRVACSGAARQYTKGGTKLGSSLILRYPARCVGIDSPEALEKMWRSLW